MPDDQRDNPEDHGQNEETERKEAKMDTDVDIDNMWIDIGGEG